MLDSNNYLMYLFREYDSNENHIIEINKAYEYASIKHANQYRKSGEPYIVHPYAVACILAEMHADVDTIIAGLLHDVVEDTDATLEEISELFNPDVAKLVDGVTKIGKKDNLSSEAAKLATLRKIYNGFREDVRIVLVKIADRLHNMRTLNFQSPEKQKKIALETMQNYARMADVLGAYLIKSELEDLCLLYTKPEDYKKIDLIRSNAALKYKYTLEEMKTNIGRELEKNYVDNDILIRIKNIFGIYNRFEKNPNCTVDDIHDLFALKVIVNDIPACYYSLGIIHKLYHPQNNMFKDYICNPKTNLYSSLHTTLFSNNNRLVQAQIRTKEMHLYDRFGLPAYWYVDHSENCRASMQEEFSSKYQFFDKFVELDNEKTDNKEFVMGVYRELFTDKVFVYSDRGDIVELPQGSTVLDYAYYIHSEVGNHLVYPVVNEQRVPLNYILKSNDRIHIMTNNDKYYPNSTWLDIVKTSYAKKRIRECLNKTHKGFNN